MGETLAKNGAYWRPAAVKDSQGILRCPDCGSQLRAKASAGGNFPTLKDVERSRKPCTAETGTLIGGKAGHVRSLLFRLSPRSLKAEGLSWQDDMEFARRYGRVDTIVTEKINVGDSDNRRSHGKSVTKRQAEQPGIMPTLYGRHLIGNTIFLSLKDMAEDLPSYDEHPTSVRMSAELAEPYREVEAKLKDALSPHRAPPAGRPRLPGQRPADRRPGRGRELAHSITV
jgi:hypothetical protein